MEILPVGSGLDFLIYLGELHLYNLFVAFSFYLLYLFCISKGSQGISVVSVLLKVWWSCTWFNKGRRDTFNDLSNSNISCFNACMTLSVWSGNLPVFAGVGSLYSSLIEQQDISLSDLQFLNVTLFLLIYRDLFLPDPTRAIYIHEIDTIHSKNNIFSLDWIKNYGKAL